MHMIQMGRRNSLWLILSLATALAFYTHGLWGQLKFRVEFDLNRNHPCTDSHQHSQFVWLPQQYCDHYYIATSQCCIEDVK